MKLETAKEVLALEWLEEADTAGTFITPEDRLTATAAGGLVAAAESGGKWSPAHDEALERRTWRLLRDERVRARVREVMGEARQVRGRVLLLVMVVLALALGFLTNEVGGGKVINLLSIPMGLLLVWNFLVYVTLLVAKWRGRKADDEGHGLHRWVNRWLLRGAGVRLDEKDRGEPPPPGSTAAMVWEARAKFWRHWIRVLRLEAFYWTEIIFHVGAAEFATCLVGGMYVRGLAFEYNAAWESTFLEAPAVSRILRVALGPASIIVRTPIPGPEAMKRLNIHDQEKMDPHERESAAKWIHLYAVTAALFIGLPRLGLAAVCGRRLRHLHEHAPVEKELRRNFDALVRQASGRESVVGLVSFFHELDGRRRDDLRAVLHRLWPGLGHVEFWPAVAYGDEEKWIEGLGARGEERAGAGAERGTGGKSVADEKGLNPLPQATGDDGDWKPPPRGLPPRVAALMSFSSTPEFEVHGFVIRELSERVPGSSDDAGVAVVLDSAAFRKQFGSLPEFDRRLRERRAAWDRLVDSVFDAAHSEESDFYVWRRVGARK
jgi:hypothetical protein